LQQGVRQNIKALTARGLTIVLVTHEPKDIDAADKVAVMGRGGRLCYYGKPANAQGFFGVSSFEDMLAAVNDDQQADYWRRRFESSPLYVQEIRGVLAPPVQPTHPAMPFYPGQPQQPAHAATATGGWDGVWTLLKDPATYQSLTQKTTYGPWLEQGKLLVRRGVEVLRNDQVNLLILLLQAPVMAALLYVLSGQNVLGPGPGAPHFDSINGRTVLLLLSVMAVFFGTNNAIREISKEGDIYERERLAGLGVVPYVMAKVALFSALVALQTLVLVVIVIMKTGLPPGSAGLFFGPFVELYIGTLLAGLAGMAMGLCVSAFANNSDKAVAILPLVLLPQILLAGVIFPLPAGPAQLLSDVAVSKWSLQAMGASVDLNHDYYVQAFGKFAQRAGTTDSAQICPQDPTDCAKIDNGNAAYAPSDFDNNPTAIAYNTTSDDATTSWADSPDGRRAHLLGSWFALLLLTAIFLAAAGIRQRVKDPT
jgi:ABC transport system ATP-binding/permease protein